MFSHQATRQCTDFLRTLCLATGLCNLIVAIGCGGSSSSDGRGLSKESVVDIQSLATELRGLESKDDTPFGLQSVSIDSTEATEDG